MPRFTIVLEWKWAPRVNSLAQIIVGKWQQSGHGFTIPTKMMSKIMSQDAGSAISITMTNMSNV